MRAYSVGWIAQPAIYTSNGKTVRKLGAESDKAFALLRPAIRTTEYACTTKQQK